MVTGGGVTAAPQEDNNIPKGVVLMVSVITTLKVLCNTLFDRVLRLNWGVKKRVEVLEAIITTSWHV